ncbi:MAG: chemotaxis protein CheW [Chloroflexi bacterium]|nr:chemotaxis protein CheW [Chloroflexota bacterium]
MATKREKQPAPPAGVEATDLDVAVVSATPRATTPDQTDQPERVDAEADETQFVTFMLDGEELGVPIAAVKEIVRVPDITRIPKAATYIEGVANLRGSILPIANLRRRFDLPDEERTDDNRVVVIEVGGRLMGLVVDQVSEVLRVSDESVEPPPPIVSATLGTDFLHGVAKLKGGERLVLLLDIDKVLPAEEVEVTTAEAVRTAARSDVEARASRQVIEEEQIVSFRVANEEYAISIDDVQEIIRVPEISHVPKAPASIDGMVALRNRLLPIVNLRKRFLMPTIELDEDSRIVVVSFGNVVTGIQVDAVSEVLSVPKDAIEPLPEIMSASAADQLRGIVRLDDGKRLIMLLDVSRILSSAELGELATPGEGGQIVSTVSEMGRRHALDEEQFVSFRVEHEEFGINIQQVQEIIWLTEITRVPRTSAFVEGIINLRGSILPVIDLRKRFGIVAAEPTDSTSIVVVDVGGRKTGIVVDAVSEVLRLNRDAIEPPPPVVAGLDVSFVEGVGKLPNGRGMLIILNLIEVLSLVELSVVA